ncbi:unnamed protein product [Pichia kudriavzevii]
MTTFVHFPLKTTDQVVWSTPLSSFLSSTFGRSFTSDLQPAFSRLDELRTNIQHASFKDADIIIPQYIDYITQIDSLRLRLPLELVTIEFKWLDTLKEEEISQKSVSFEKASIMYNLACLHSYKGSVAASNIDWKLAVSSFAHASGIFEYMASHFLHSPASDLDVHASKLFSHLMSAQAQECFLWNYMHTAETKHSLVAKLAKGVSERYEKVIKYLNKGVDLDCLNECKWKKEYFLAFAYFHDAQNYGSVPQIGYAITSASQGLDTCKELRKIKVDSILNDIGEELKKEITSKLKEWEKDNDLIYHHAVPDKINVPAIKKLEGAKSIDFEKQLMENGGCRDLFDKIVPMEAHQSMSIYSEKQAQILRKLKEEINVANEEVVSVFEFSKIPSSIIEIQNLLRSRNSTVEEEEREKEAGYPRVLAMAHEMETSSMSSDQFDMTGVNSKREEIKESLEKIDELLMKDDKNMLIKSLPINNELTKLRDEVSSTRRIMVEADLSDSKLSDLWSKYEVEISVLRKGVSKLHEWLSSSNTDDLNKQISLLDLDDLSDNFDINTANELIENIYANKKSLELLVNERNSTLQDLTEAMHAEDISSVLINYRDASDEELEQVFLEQLSKYDAYRSRINDLIDAQPNKIFDLKESLGSLLDLGIVKKKLEEKKRERGTVKSKINRLIDAYEAFKLCTKGVGEAVNFYTKLQHRTSEILNRIQSIVNQRDSYISDSRSSIGSDPTGNLGGFGGYTVNYPQQQQPPAYSTSSEQTPNIPPLPSKPAYTGNTHSSLPYSTPSVYDPNMYSQFGQSWK